jgi:hypothetical protein
MDTVELSPECLIEESELVLDAEMGRGAFGAVYKATLKGRLLACAKVRACL